MSQITKGTTYTSTGTGSQVTHTNLNAHVDNATLLAGAVIEQSITTISNNTDTLLIAQGTNPATATINSQLKSDFTKSLTSQTIDAGAGNDLILNAYDGPTLTGKSYTSANGITNTVTSVAHGLIAGQQVLISSATDSKYNGVFRLTSVTADAFVYTMDQIKGAGSFVSANGILVTVTTGSAHGLTNGQTVAIATLVTGYSGTFTIAVTGTTTFTYSLTSAQTATSGTITYLANAALQGFGTLSYADLATVKNAGSKIITANAYVDGNTKLAGDLTVAGGVAFNTTSAIKLPSGTTSQRPSNPLLGQMRYNTDSTFTEVYNGTTWAVVGAAPFNATGGDTVIAPDKIVTTATFISTDGAKVVVTSTAHTVYVGTTVAFLTTSTGYSGTWTVTEKTTDTFTFWMDVVRTPVTTATGCTYNKNFQYKTHIFSSTGPSTFIPTNLGSTGEIEVLIVGGGGGAAILGGGGGGGYVYLKNYKIKSLTSINVYVGSGGIGAIEAVGGNGENSSFGTIIAYGGNGSTNRGPGGNSGGNNIGGVSYSGSYGQYGNGTGGGGGGCYNNSIANGSSTFAWFIAGSGIKNNITGKIINYGVGGTAGYYGIAENLAKAMSGIDSYLTVNTTFANTGCGGFQSNSGVPCNGASGIVVVRYPWTPT